MIISASRRTDIPAFYSPWFIHRIQEGYCCIPNPFNSGQIARVSLLPMDVEMIVFWTRFPLPIFAHLEGLSAQGYRFYFQYTLMDNPRPIDTRTPSLKKSLEIFKELANRIGPDKVIWRYDPIILSQQTSINFHRDRYAFIADQLRGATYRSVISLMDSYPKTTRRLLALAQKGIHLHDQSQIAADLPELIPDLVKTAAENDMEIVSCAEEWNLAQYGVKPGKCIDADFILKVFNLQIKSRKDPSQRQLCGCAASKDIGEYNSCQFGCQYCYATRDFKLAKENFHTHNTYAPSMLGKIEGL